MHPDAWDDIVRAMASLPPSELVVGSTIRVKVGERPGDVLHFPGTPEIVVHLAEWREAEIAVRQAQLDMDEARADFVRAVIPQQCATAGLLALTLALGAMGFDVLSIIGAIATGLATVGVFSRGGDDDER